MWPFKNKQKATKNMNINSLVANVILQSDFFEEKQKRNLELLKEEENKRRQISLEKEKFEKNIDKYIASFTKELLYKLASGLSLTSDGTSILIDPVRNPINLPSFLRDLFAEKLEAYYSDMHIQFEYTKHTHPYFFVDVLSVEKAIETVFSNQKNLENPPHPLHQQGPYR